MYTEKLPNGKIKYFDYYKDYYGKKRKVSVTLEKDTKQNQKLAFKMLEEKIEKEIEKQTKEYTMEYSVFDVFDEYVEYKKNTIKPTSLITFNVNYKWVKNNLKNIKLNELRAKHIYSIFNENTRNVKAKLFLIKNFLEWCYKRDYIDSIEFLQKVDLSHLYRERKRNKLYLEKEEIHDILNFFENSHLYNKQILCNIIKLQVHTGLRIGEVLALNYSDLKDNKLTINKILYKNKIHNFTKSKSSTRTIPVNDEVVKVFEEQKELNLKRKIVKIEYNQLLFRSNRAGVITNTTIQTMLNEYKKIKLYSHIFRHTHASLLIEQGITVDDVARRLGHNDTTITKEIYIHITNKQKEKEYEIFKNLKII